MSAEMKVSTQADADADDAATLRDAADTLRRHLPDAIDALAVLDMTADMLDPIDAEIAEPDPADVWNQAIADAKKALLDAREAGGAYGQQDRRPSNFKRAAGHLDYLINPYRKADQ